jgi:hypothetical protein
VNSGEATNTNCIVFCLTRSGLEPTIYCTRGEHANHYTSKIKNYYCIRITNYKFSSASFIYPYLCCIKSICNTESTTSTWITLSDIHRYNVRILRKFVYFTIALEASTLTITPPKLRIIIVFIHTCVLFIHFTWSCIIQNVYFRISMYQQKMWK